PHGLYRPRRAHDPGRTISRQRLRTLTRRGGERAGHHRSATGQWRRCRRVIRRKTRMTHVLVAGGAGYIGSHACMALAAAGFIPVTYDNLVHCPDEAVRWGPLIRADIADRARLDIVMAEFKPVAVMHFAAHT